MSFLDELRSLASTPQSAWLLFIGCYRDEAEDVYIFCEGPDDLGFYLPHVKRFSETKATGRAVHGFYCGGKDGVVDVVSRVKQRLDRECRALFFMDKDVDDLVDASVPWDMYLFCTEVYAIENYLADVATIEVIWTELLKLPKSDARLSRICGQFVAAHASFVAAMTTVMAYVVTLRRAGYHVVLNDVSMERVVNIDDECVTTLKDDWRNHLVAASNTPMSAVVSADALQQVVVELAQLEPKSFVRGKFEMWFFVRFVGRVCEVAAERNGDTLRAVCRVPLGVRTVIDVMAGRCLCPTRLAKFLSRALSA